MLELQDPLAQLAPLENQVQMVEGEFQEMLEPQESKEHQVMMENPARMDRKERKDPPDQQDLKEQLDHKGLREIEEFKEFLGQEDSQALRVHKA